jgi:putative membrane protein
MPGAVSMAVPYMQVGGEGDVYEVTSSEIAVKRATSADVKRFAAMLVEHHTMTTNVLLAQAKAAGLTPPPAVLGQGKREWIDDLLTASPAEFDRVYLLQQVSAHEQAFALHQAYAASGDTPELKVAAAGAVPIVERHLAQARRLAAR